MIPCVAVQMLGTWSIEAGSDAGGGRLFEPIIFCLAVLCFVTMLRRVRAVPLEPATAASGSKVRNSLFVIWTAYPVTHLCRSLGLLSARAEEVLVYTFLDFLSKSMLLLMMSS